MSVKILVVGVGSIGERHLRCFQRLPDVDVSLCEPLAERRQDIADRYGVSDSFADVVEASSHSWDAAIVCTPAHQHVEHALLLLEKTGSLLIEKPLSTDLAAARRLIDGARGKTVGVAYVQRAHPAVERVRNWLNSGELGQPLQVTIVAGQHFPTFRPAYRQIYYARRESGGGAIQDAATHMFDVAQHLVGRFDWVFCDAAHQTLADVEVEDTVHVTARAAMGQVLVSLALNQFMAPNETTLQINGDRASARIEFHSHRCAIQRLGETSWTTSEPLIRERDELFERQASLFLEGVAGARSILCPLEEGLHSLEINLAALKSAAEGTKVQVV